MVRVALDYIGCRLNQAEVEAVAEELNSAGYQIVSPDSSANLYILNTCSVTGVAEAKCRHRISRAKSLSPKARVIAFGCYVRRDAQSLRATGADLTLSYPEELVDLVREMTPPLPGKGSDSLRRTRSFIKIQEGCDTPCSYCIVPMVRGGERSRPPKEILAEIGHRYQIGYREIVLTGTNIGRYRWNGFTLKELLQEILYSTKFPRIRISSLQPQDVTDELFSLWKDNRLAPHFHLPLQSGSSQVLKRMNRRYSVEEFKEAVAKIKNAIPEASITSDILVGFPGESQEDFLFTYNLCQEIGFSKLHVFPFSPRPQTLAANLSQPPQKEVKNRVKILCQLSERLSYEFRERHLGRWLEVLWEGEEGGVYRGLSGNYLRVYARSPQPLIGQITWTRITNLTEDGLWGQVLENVTGQVGQSPLRQKFL